MTAHSENTVTVSAGTAGQLFPENASRTGAFVQSYMDHPVYISKTNPPIMGPPSLMIPPGSLVDLQTAWFDFGTLKPTEAHFYLSPGSGSVAVWEWGS